MSERMLIGAVAAQECVVPPEVVVDVLRWGAEDVVMHAMGVELFWSTSAITRQDDLKHAGGRTGREDVSPEFVARRWASGDPESAAFGARSAVMHAAVQEDFRLYDPRMEVADVGAHFPTPVAWSPEPVGGLTVHLAMQRWAMYGGGERLDWAVGRLEQWVLAAAAAIEAESGFVTAVEQSLGYSDSPWEKANRLAATYRDVSRTVWGFGWGTLLGPAQLATVGGLEALRPVTTSLHELTNGRVWARIGGADPAAVTPEELAALQAVLDPALAKR